jgi:hypothetical protein
MALTAATVKRVNELLEEIYQLINPVEEPEPVAAIKALPDEVELEGIVGRPECKTVGGKVRFTAGLGVTEGNITRWVNVVAWNETARLAEDLSRGRPSEQQPGHCLPQLSHPVAQGARRPTVNAHRVHGSYVPTRMGGGDLFSSSFTRSR